ncbi:hypothetical protein SCUP234_06162 [Seiridium cupressi]
MASDPAQPSAHPAALAKLQPLVAILAGFNHRNKNQHRHARWWAAFNSLRRNVSRLISELEIAAQKAQKSSGSGKKRKREGKDADGEGREGAVEERAKWMRDYAVPEAYLPFSQLAADNQFAVLGIVLLGVLASVREACVQLVGEADPEIATTEMPSVVSEPVVMARGDTTKPGGGKTGFAMAAAEEVADSGQVVSREEIAAAIDTQSAKAVQPVDEPLMKRKRRDVADTVATKSAEKSSSDGGKAIEKLDKASKDKKKKKKKKGDEFDALFSSLV